MRRRLIIGMAILTIAMSSLFLTYWIGPNRVIWTKEGRVTTVHQYTDPAGVTNWNILVFISQQNDMGYLVNTGFIALNGSGTQSRGNFCWNDGNGGCLPTPLTFTLNQILTIEALNNGNFIVTS